MFLFTLKRWTILVHWHILAVCTGPLCIQICRKPLATTFLGGFSVENPLAHLPKSHHVCPVLWVGECVEEFPVPHCPTHTLCTHYHQVDTLAFLHLLDSWGVWIVQLGEHMDGRDSIQFVFCRVTLSFSLLEFVVCILPRARAVLDLPLTQNGIKSQLLMLSSGMYSVFQKKIFP